MEGKLADDFIPGYLKELDSLIEKFIKETISSVVLEGIKFREIENLKNREIIQVPLFDEEKNIEYWSKLEISKRRFLYITQRLDIFPRPKQNPDDALGLSFRFLVPTEDQPVMTGHANGVITLNAFEADHLYREQTRITMGENYRTLLGHFRHESGHYYFDVLIANTDWINEFRQIFGDERQDYGQALQHYYEHSDPKDWQDHFISTYASSHPWADWAETWSHYLHMLSTLDTAYHIVMTVAKRN
ncbi:MAG: putative zinc-binding metallopeptidase, partial [Bacteroidetes bacterium]|nr:putative zinc-binding metallopeptidase [Bacteroidota bacterium]